MNLIKSAIGVCRFSNLSFSNLKNSVALTILVGLFWLIPVLLKTRSIVALAEDQEEINSANIEDQTTSQENEVGDRVNSDMSDEESTAQTDSEASDPPESTVSETEDTPSPNNEEDNIEGNTEEGNILTQDGESSASVPDEKTTAPAPEQRDWISAWISDLKQSNDRWIQVNLSEQKLTAWEGDTPVFSTEVSTGREGDWTPTGVYNIEEKFKTARMQGDDYDISNVPYVMYFFGSYAIHGTFWHHNFGTPVSRGCINVEDDQAAWLFYWASEGTPVIVQSEEY